jgi:putative serine protease PepD
LVISGYAPPAWLGVSITTVTSSIESQYDLSVEYGAFVVEVLSGSPADSAGLEAEDVIIEFAGEEINTAQELVTAIRSHEPGDTVNITFMRGEEEKTTQAILVQKSSS